MNADELDFTSVSHDTNKKEPLIIEDGTFSWGNEEDDKPVLRNITLKVQPGHLVAVVGAIGAGKTSLISAFMGEMVRNSGYANTKSGKVPRLGMFWLPLEPATLNGRIAYVAQQAWIQNATVKDNIVFGSNFDEKHYFKTVKNCALEQDFKMLSGGDATEIGEKDQHGFRGGKSVTTADIDFVNAIDRGGQAVGIFMDLSKAFEAYAIVVH
ncbi:Canalicular multispecific organic anion transporter 1 [Homalodisca vitripennis]|nr:Canalicular multispecific organic anion transporter 1 [Homalodisca vitripennis]